mmetsp:Transcript_7348/g.20821  ORF Transcript_7348/g.20821 Transcript_7348/m.20821 type:complete len:222 (-) Transcript_7348:24-689(-)
MAKSNQMGCLTFPQIDRSKGSNLYLNQAQKRVQPVVVSVSYTLAIGFAKPNWTWMSAKSSTRMSGQDLSMKRQIDRHTICIMSGSELSCVLMIVGNLSMTISSSLMTCIFIHSSTCFSNLTVISLKARICGPTAECMIASPTSSAFSSITSAMALTSSTISAARSLALSSTLSNIPPSAALSSPSPVFAVSPLVSVFGASASAAGAPHPNHEDIAAEERLS